jgi:hypothetical protein
MKKSPISRRSFLGTGATAAAALAVVPFSDIFYIGSQAKKPNSKVGGVQLGCTTYSYRDMPHKVDEVIPYLLLAGISSIELRSVAEEDLGIPGMPPRPRGTLSDQEKAEYAKATEAAREEQRKWRLSLPMLKYEEMRKKFNKAGMSISQNWPRHHGQMRR